MTLGWRFGKVPTGRDSECSSVPTHRKGDVVAVLINSGGDGGMTAVALSLVREITARGLEVDLVVDTRGNKPYLTGLPAGASVFSLETRFEYPVLSWFKSASAIRRYLRQRRPRLLLSMLTAGNGAAVLAKLASRTDVHVALAEHLVLTAPRMARYPEHEVRTGLSLRRYLGARKRAMRLLYRLADSVVTVGHGMAGHLREYLGYDHNLHVIRNPLISDRLDRLASEYPVTDTFFQRQCPYILGIGRFTPVKNFDCLLEAFAIVARRRPARLVMIGRGPLFENAKRKAAELGVTSDVLFTGFVANPFPYFLKCHIIALSSYSETLPNVLVEGMYFGLQVASVDCAYGPRELTADGRYGYLAKVDDPESLAEAIVHCLDRPIPREEIIGRTRDYQVKESVDRYLALAGLTSNRERNE